MQHASRSCSKNTVSTRNYMLCQRRRSTDQGGMECSRGPGSAHHQPYVKCRERLQEGTYRPLGIFPCGKGWLDRCYAYRQLIRLRIGKNVSNYGNSKRFARRCDILNPMQYTLRELTALYKECKEQTTRIMAESPWMRNE